MLFPLEEAKSGNLIAESIFDSRPTTLITPLSRVCAMLLTALEIFKLPPTGWASEAIFKVAVTAPAL